MTPQLQQAIRLLQLSTLDLRMEIQQALDSNLMLELSEDEAESEASTTDEPNGLHAEEDVQPTDIPKELPTDSNWEDVYDSSPAAAPASNSHTSMEFENQGHHEEGLREHLYWQMEFSHFSDNDRVIAETIIDAIDDDGYLSISPEEILEIIQPAQADLELEDIEAVLHQVQNFDPLGVGARDLRECLLLQLQQAPVGTPWREQAIRLVSEHLELLASKDYARLMRHMKLGENELQELVQYIQTLQPRPGSVNHATPPEYIVPDVLVRKVKGAWRVTLNTEILPRIRVNAQYASMVRRADNSRDNTCLKTHLQEARWFIKSLQSRSDTLLKVARCIVERQQAFFEYGPEAMKAMVLHDVAEAVEMHESTISRVTSHKYMHTPRGIFELKYFFSSHVSTQAGGECSSTAIRALLIKLIEAENPRKPLSDNKLAAILVEQGINVARRTVAKYRDALTIPSSSERKQLM